MITRRSCFVSAPAAAELSAVPILALGVLLFSVGMRIATTAALDSLQITWPFVVFATHLRLDGFALGLLLAWFYAFRPTVLERFARRRVLLLVVAFVLLAFAALLPVNLLMSYTVGTAIFSMAYACVLLVVLYAPLEIGKWAAVFHSWPMRAIIFVGCVQLHHLSVAHYARAFVGGAKPFGFPCGYAAVDNPDPPAREQFHFAGLASRLIELPMLRVRDRLFPAKARALVEEV